MYVYVYQKSKSGKLSFGHVKFTLGGGKMTINDNYIHATCVRHKSIPHGQVMPHFFQKWPHCFFLNVLSVLTVHPTSTGSPLEATSWVTHWLCNSFWAVRNGGDFFFFF